MVDRPAVAALRAEVNALPPDTQPGAWQDLVFRLLAALEAGGVGPQVQGTGDSQRQPGASPATVAAPELKPCPFCGGAALIDSAVDDETEWFVHCRVCEATLGPVFEDSPCADEDTPAPRVMLTGAWNRRAGAALEAPSPQEFSDPEHPTFHKCGTKLVAGTRAACPTCAEAAQHLLGGEAPPEPTLGTCGICDAPLPHATDAESLKRSSILHDAYEKFEVRGEAGPLPPDDKPKSRRPPSPRPGPFPISNKCARDGHMVDVFPPNGAACCVECDKGRCIYGK